MFVELSLFGSLDMRDPERAQGKRWKGREESVQRCRRWNKGSKSCPTQVKKQDTVEVKGIEEARKCDYLAWATVDFPLFGCYDFWARRVFNWSPVKRDVCCFKRQTVAGISISTLTTVSTSRVTVKKSQLFCLMTIMWRGIKVLASGSA